MEYVILGGLALWLVWFTFRLRIKGHLGEARLCRHLRRYNIPYLQDLRVPGITGRTYQIDVLARIGEQIFVIEVKNYAGVIEADAYERDWVQRLGRTRRHFYNPLHQNYGHVQALRENLPGAAFKGLVVFVGNARFSGGFPNGVMDLRGFRWFLDRLHVRRLDAPHIAWEQICQKGFDRAARRALRRQRAKAGLAWLLAMVRKPKKSGMEPVKGSDLPS